MKVLLLSDRMEAGGAETHVAQLALGLREMGVEVVLLSSGGSIADALESEGIRQVKLPLPSHRPLCLYRMRGTLRRLVRRERFDLLHAHTRLTAWLLRGIRGTRRIVTIHAKFRRYTPLSRLFYWGDGTVAVSEDLREELIDGYGIAAERIRVIANGVDCRRFAPPPSGPPAHAPHLLFASRLDEDCARGAELLCRIAPTLTKTHPGIRISIAGGGAAYERLCTQAEATNQRIGYEAIRLCGFVSSMPELLRETDIFVGVSRAAMEAAACGCAVILCGNEGYLGPLTAGTAREAVLSNLCARGCPSPTEEALARDVRLLLDNLGFRREAAMYARELILTHFSAERMCRETLRFYHRLLPHKPRLRLVLGGYFGCGNLGDDAILQGLLEALHSIAPDVSAVALTARPRRDSRRFGIPCRQRRNPLAVAIALRRADAFLCGGGSLLQNLTSNRSLSYYLSLIRRARRASLPVFFYASGIGPLLSGRACRRTVRALSLCRYISLRDAESRRWLLALGVDASLLHDSADPALLLPLPPLSRAQALLRNTPLHMRYLCIVLKGGYAQAQLRRVILAGLAPICRARGLFPLFLIFDEAHDGMETREAAAQLGGIVLPMREAGDAAAILSSAVGVVTMRLHAMILATAVNTPALGIPADPRDHKIDAFAKESGQDTPPTVDPTIADISHATEQMLDSFESKRRLLRETGAEMRKKARKDLENILQMLYNMDNEWNKKKH